MDSDAAIRMTNAGHAQLRKVLKFMFPEEYIQKSAEQLGCSPLLAVRKKFIEDDDDSQPQQPSNSAGSFRMEPSSEPSPRAQVRELRQRFDLMLAEHQAKPFGLCPVRRAIYDQCFDEIIRQTTVGCIEQGLLLFRVRNELRSTLDCYRRVHESAVIFGLNKTLEAELKLDESRHEIDRLARFKADQETEISLQKSFHEVEVKNKLESIERVREYFQSELMKKDQVIKQQRELIINLTRNIATKIKGPSDEMETELDEVAREH